MSGPYPSPGSHPTDRLAGDSPAMHALRAQIRHLAVFDTPGRASIPTVLLQGETGTGKGLVAQVIHESGPRAPGPFIEVNCAAIPETLLEAELFGFMAGAFTDAKRAKPGLFEAASGGTLVLDEIDALPLALQGKLLTAIEAKRVRRLGAVVERTVDIKLIAATQVELSRQVEQGGFRADLYHRLAVVVLTVPPLRKRDGDILDLAREFLRQQAEAHGTRAKRLSKGAEAWLLSYRWPGNVRELKHLMERATLLHAGTDLDAKSLEQLALSPSSAVDHETPEPLSRASRSEDEAERIRQALAWTGGNVVKAARLLGVSRDAVRYRMRRYSIGRPSAEALSSAFAAFPMGQTPSPTHSRPVPQGFLTDLAPLKTPASRPHNLPAQPTPLIGRDRELAAAHGLLQREDVRLVTFTGTAGTGKTRLALQVAADSIHTFRDGVFFVPLAPINDPALVASTVARTLGTRETAGRPVLENLKDFLGEKHMLLLLDNFEQVVSAAPVAAELLAACSGLKVLATSRMALHVRGEHEFPVPPLALPDPKRLSATENLSQYAAVALFTQRARAVDAAFAINDENASAVAEICVRLDGLPLAIELAAARIKLLPPKALLARLGRRLELLQGGPRDLPARHQTLRRAISWSYDLLDADEGALFRRLAVFVGGCTLEAAAQVWKAGGAPAAEAGHTQEIAVLDGMASLLDKNLLQREEQPDGEPRFFMLETIREYGLECLAASGEMAATRRAHAAYCLALAEEAEPELTGPRQAAWLERLEREHDNLRAALQWAEDSGEVPTGLRLGSALWRFWIVRGHLQEGQERLARLLALPEASTYREACAKVLIGAGTLAHNRGDYAAARARFEESLAIWRELGDKGGIAAALNNLGWMGLRLGEYAKGRAFSEESLTLYRELGDKRGIAAALNNLGWLAHHQGDYATAQSFHVESLALRRELGDKRGIAFALNNLGWAVQKLGDAGRATALLEEALDLFREVGEKQLFAFASSLLGDVVHEQGDDRRAVALLAQSLTLFRQIGDTYGCAFALGIQGSLVREQRDYERATALYEESLALRRQIGDKWGIAAALNGLATVAHEQGDDGRAVALYEEGLALRRAIGDKHGIAECLEGLAGVAVAQQHLERAAKLMGVAETLREAMQAPRSPRERRRCDHLIAALRPVLGEAAAGLHDLPVGSLSGSTGCCTGGDELCLEILAPP